MHLLSGIYPASVTPSGVPPALHRDGQGGAARRSRAEPSSQVHGGRMLSGAAWNGMVGRKLAIVLLVGVCRELVWQPGTLSAQEAWDIEAAATEPKILQNQ